MHNLANRKNKIVLTDYNYKRDIETRLLMSKFSLETVDVLKEIIDGSLKTSVDHLLESLEMPQERLLQVLEFLQPTMLFRRQGNTLVVDKETRKYLEQEIHKFDPHYEIGMEFLQSMLTKVPMDVIPNWYQLPKTSDHLFPSIVDKFLLTPQIYQRYLDDLVIDYPNGLQIAREVLKHFDAPLTAAYLMEKYHMSHEAFHECMLHLEYNFACCLTYRLIDGHFEQIVTPFSEWREHLTFLQNTKPKTIENPETIIKDYENDFGFLTSLNGLLTGNCAIPENMLSTLKMLKLQEETEQGWQPTDRIEHWLKLPLQEQAASLYRCMLQKPYDEHFQEKDLRQIQKSLKLVTKLGWIYFDDFFKGLSQAIGGAQETMLKSRGKRWRYARPALGEAERKFTHYALFKVFLQVGIIATGKQEGKPCFCVTTFGRLNLEN